MTGLAQIFILAFVIIVVMIFFYILYNYAINEFKKSYRNNKIETGIELIETIEKDLAQLKKNLKMNNPEDNKNSESIKEIINNIETDIELLKNFIEDI